MNTTQRTEQQRENLEMFLVMWTAVDPASVIKDLEDWTCGTQACAGGHLATWRYFIKQGVRRNAHGAPYMPGVSPGAAGSALELFGDWGLFYSRGRHEYDPRIFDAIGYRISDHELVLRRLELALFGEMESPQFPPEIKPVHAGVYRTEYDGFITGETCRGFSWWNGSEWGNQYDTPERASQRRFPVAARQDNRWSGLARKPVTNTSEGDAA